MHLVTIKSGQALFAKCPSCKGLLAVHSNPNKAPVKVAFNHPKQAFNAKCPACAKDFSWNPEELEAAEIEQVKSATA